MGGKAYHGETVKGSQSSALKTGALAAELASQWKRDQAGDDGSAPGSSWGLCPSCGHERSLDHGRLRWHRRYVSGTGRGGQAVRVMVRCPGSGEYPAPIGD